MARLDTQRAVGHLHGRPNSRYYQRGYATVPHSVWGDAFGPAGPAGPISMASITPATFAATTGAKVLVLRGTGFVAPVTVNVAGTAFTGGAVVINSTTQITLTMPDGSAFAAKLGVQPVYVQMNAGASNSMNVTITATLVVLDEMPDNPAAYTIAQIQTWVDGHADLADEVLAAEMLRDSPRVTLVDWLEGFISHRDEGTIP